MNYFISFLLTLCAFLNQDASTRHHYPKNGNKIVGGKNVTIQDYPYQAYVFVEKIPENDENPKYVQCGGSIISRSFVLSAAHCFLNASKVQIRIGSTEAMSGGSVYEAEYFKNHHKYDTVTKDYDIAIVKTLKKMDLDGENSEKIKLVDSKIVIPPGSMVRISGWGKISSDGPLSPTLKAVELPTISNEECNEILGGISDRQLCIGTDDGKEDICKGDSGGPAVLIEDKVQVGIVSASYGCAVPHSPSIFVNVTDLRHWVKRHTGV